jgi:hypothetical protein
MVWGGREMLELVNLWKRYRGIPSIQKLSFVQTLGLLH